MRRLEDSITGYYVDRYKLKVLMVALGILLLCGVDAHITLMLLSKGGSELNGIMDFFIKQGTLPFVIGKYIITSVGLILLVTHHKFYFLKKIKVKYILCSFLIGYMLLIFYELAIWPDFYSKLIFP